MQVVSFSAQPFPCFRSEPFCTVLKARLREIKSVQEGKEVRVAEEPRYSEIQIAAKNLASAILRSKLHDLALAA